MKRLAVLLALLAPFAVQAQPAPRAALTDWTRRVEATAEGGFRMGNPDAPVKLVEYLSFACSHCAEFQQQSEAALINNYVRSGRVSLEYRNILTNPADVPATMLARCAGGRGYFAMGHELLRTQGQWSEAVNRLTDAQRAQLRDQPPAVFTQRLAAMIGLDRMAARHGLNANAQRACFGNAANFAQLDALSQQARDQYGVQGTPTFMINGRVVADTNVWSGIEPRLRGN